MKSILRTSGLCISIIGLLLFIGSCSNNNSDHANLVSDGSHDLSLPQWGPYTKKYVGISHIPNVEEGLRFDLAVFPSFYNKAITPPDVLKTSNFHPWEASPNLEYFSYRHDLEWKDKVYADIAYAKIDDDARAIKMTCVNNTDTIQDLALHMLASMHFPPLAPHKPEVPLNYAKVNLPENGIWVDALDYETFTFKHPWVKDQLVPDGMLRGEVRENGLVNGSGIGKGFGKRTGDLVTYQFSIQENIKDAVIAIRYKTEKDDDAKLQLNGIVNTNITLPASAALNMIKVPLGEVKKGKFQLNVETKSKSPLVIDGYAIVSQSDFDAIKIEPVKWNSVPKIVKGPSPNSMILKYENTDTYYGVSWDYPDYKMAEWFAKDLPNNFNEQLNASEKNKFYGDKGGHFTDAAIQQIKIDPNASKTVNAMVCSGNLEEVKAQLKDVANLNYQKVFTAAKKNLHQYNTVPEGEKYLFSQKRMAATTISNVVYPIYTQHQYIRHHAPGRKWDCLYTWDSGFIGIGLTQLDLQRGTENLNAYLTGPEEQSAFIHHGTPLPVQIYLFQELWNKNQSDDFLKEEYPRLKRYYDFLIGNTSTSSTRNLDSGLIATWDYFYNSGGWDDYPPQKYMHKNKMTKTTAPVVSSAHMIRVAKILKMAAEALNKSDDVNGYIKDIESLSTALNDYSWDEESGYYGYVLHSSSGNPEEILKYNDSINYNMGLGGVSPLIAGIGTEDQIKKTLSHLKTKGELWSDVGLSTVDQSAPYFNPIGYWNGRVWMPHQWFYWKAMLDLGEADFAHKIATTALDVWKRETEKTYNCYESFSIETKGGKGWYQFSGLSAPVLSWFNAYYQIGNLTAGYDVWIEKQKFNKEYTKLEASLKVMDHADKPFSLIACLNPDYSYDVYWNDKKVSHKEFNKGTLSITITSDLSVGDLRIEKIKE
ncbi:MGH1-like glycoside hydrolase domain-containing protein [Aequorivita marina]|uniref:MGH1-like glycoside hydrolase domain-containing protein n=1 Tax=Aequorivita marina TaxID=3073654 RepID=UPI002874DA9B|nr:trehalase family glycosidase [Aequorivita sp. S2608]MDS1298973.1 trehalase family glycosidase [Aequorivita sp. S2608]